ncbi:MAG TPA: NAD-dependent epimerase/dehydratase family protein [Pyrinomonadaceae bacterium]|nr:NAD-dependent epimerase/dehydratase family protein [Pyrinomonadaceae bacterium]
MNHTVFITGGAGYIGFALVEKFLQRRDVERIIALDKEPIPHEFVGKDKVVYMQNDTSNAWEKEVEKYAPDIVIHAAWQIRDIYGNYALQKKWNIDGTDKVFDFAFTQPKVTRLVHFSTVASYGSYADNTIEHRFTEDEPFRPSEYKYAEEKKIVEEHLKEKYETAHARGSSVDVAIVRPAAITGPRGRYARLRFGLQSALSGQLKGSFIYRLVSMMTSFVPSTPTWVRQFVHEDDVVDIVELLAFSENVKNYEAFNLCPPGDVVLPKDMAKAVGKHIVPMPPFLIRIAFFWMWHLTRGKIPTAPGAWKGYSYPIAVDGSKITRLHGYQYRMEGKDAFVYTDGRYESVVPEPLRKKRPV